MMLLLAASSFAISIDLNKYWTNRIGYVGNIVLETHPDYLVKLTATTTDLTITISSSDPSVSFTKYDNISISTIILEQLQVIYIVTGNYSRKVLVKNIMNPPKKVTLMSMTVLSYETPKKK